MWPIADHESSLYAAAIRLDARRYRADQRHVFDEIEPRRVGMRMRQLVGRLVDASSRPTPWPGPAGIARSGSRCAEPIFKES